MVVRLINLRFVLMLGLVFVAGITVFTVLNGRRPNLAGGSGGGVAAHPRTTDEQIAALQQTVRSHPRDADEYVLLADAYMQKVRETGDAGFYRRADGVLRIARRIDPSNSALYTGLGTLALA